MVQNVNLGGFTMKIFTVSSHCKQREYQCHHVAHLKTPPTTTGNFTFKLTVFIIKQN